MTKEQYIKLSSTHHLLPPLLFSPVALYLIYLGYTRGQALWWQGPLLLATGFFIWTFVEYVLHRFQFHWKIEKEPWNLLISEFHLLHHEMPNHPLLVIAPLTMAIPVYGLMLGLLWLISKSFIVMGFIGAGIIAGYLVYEWVHYFTHHGKPKTRVGKYLKQYHMIHHFKDSNNYYGVTSPFWDLIFRTKPAYDPKADHEILPIMTRAKI